MQFRQNLLFNSASLLTKIRYLLIFGLFSQTLFSQVFAQFDTSSSDHKINQYDKTVLVFGDSLSAAYNIQREKGWTSLLQDLLNREKLQVKVVNASISGETTSGGLERLEKQLLLHKPSIVILELGGNDGLRGFDLATTKNNLTKMIEMSINHSSKVLLAGIAIPPNYGRTYTKRFSAIYSELAQQQDVELIPFILEQVATKSEYMQADGIHPNENGQSLVLATVWEYLAPLLNESMD